MLRDQVAEGVLPVVEDRVCAVEMRFPAPDVLVAPVSSTAEECVPGTAARLVEPARREDASERSFDRRAILAVQGAWGELGLGRAGTVQSTAAPYSMGSIKWDVFGTSYTNSSIGTTCASSNRVDNSINYISPVMNNLKFGLSYSTGNKDADDANERIPRLTPPMCATWMGNARGIRSTAEGP